MTLYWRNEKIKEITGYAIDKYGTQYVKGKTVAGWRFDCPTDVLTIVQ